MANTASRTPRPPKSWWRRCIRGVTDSSTAVVPESVCGGNWYHKMTPKARARAKRKYPN